jgi:macrolide-specific efflux system membrane fusion protein
MTATKWRRERRTRRAAPRPRRGASRRPAWYLIVLAAVGVVAVVLGILDIGSPTSSARTTKQIVTAERGIVQSTVTGSGDVEPAVDDSVSFQTSGTLKHLYVKQGDHVVKGQLLATLDSTAAQDTVDQADEELTAAKDSLSAAETASSSSTTSDSSTAADPADDTSFVSYATTSTTSTTPTVSSPTPTATSPTHSTTTPSHATTTSPATTTVTVTAPSTTTTPSSSSAGGERLGGATGDSAGAGTTGASDGDTGSAAGTGGSTGGGSSGSSQTTTSNPDTLASNVASAQAQVDSAEATLKSAQTALNETKLYASASGTVVSVEDVSPGDAVSGSSTASSDSSSTGSSSDSSSGSSSGATTSGSLGGSSSDSSTGSSSSSSSTGLVEIVNTHTMTVTVPFDESDVSKLKVGQPATITFDALTGVELAAKVSSISTIGTTSDSVVSYDATLTLTQRNAQVKPGMTASAAVIYQQAAGVTLPNSAVPGTSNIASVDVTKSGKTTPTSVIVGVRGDSRTQIVKGLSAGQQVVVTETLPSTSTASSSGSSSTSGTLGGTSSGFGGSGFGGGGFGGGGFAGRFGGG